MPVRQTRQLLQNGIRPVLFAPPGSAAARPLECRSM
nr:MAG TPA: hypothetical protein [Caudoviricetes sp.]